MKFKEVLKFLKAIGVEMGKTKDWTSYANEYKDLASTSYIILNESFDKQYIKFYWIDITQVKCPIDYTDKFYHKAKYVLDSIEVPADKFFLTAAVRNSKLARAL